MDTTDCEVTPELVADLLRTQLPRTDLVPGSVRSFDDGCDSWVYVGDVRGRRRVDAPIPEARGGGGAPGTRDPTAAALAPTLPLPVPRFELVGQPSSAYPASAIPEASRIRAARLMDHPPTSAAPEVLIQADFFPEHLLVRGGEAIGVIDWGDVAIGDPAADFGGLSYWLGEPLLRAGLHRYGRLRGIGAAVTDDLRTRAHFVAVCRAITDLEYGLVRDRRPYVDAALRALRLSAEP